MKFINFYRRCLDKDSVNRAKYGYSVYNKEYLWDDSALSREEIGALFGEK